jgi:RNA polymerase sigma-70 factor (ECF subfamily)
MAAKKREVLALYELEQLGVDEIAERLGCSPGTVKSRLHHARAEFTAIARKMGCLDPEALI